MVSVVEHKTGDGRVARGARTRQALAEALITLLEEGAVQPPARRIAERAGVSLRLVFHHFDDLESILYDAVRIQEERHWRHIRPVAATLPLDDRVTRLVRQRDLVFAATAPVRRSAEHFTPSSATVVAELTRGHQALRNQLQATFAPELATRRPGEARLLLDALDVATSWETWQQLDRLGRSPTNRRRTMEALTRALFCATPTGGGR